ncbi:YceI family protein [Chryseobacterium sp. Y16C]|uniref:YceI family protein n=1 Tax=Chryseobacterium sp. Y16C TaxID=2920939 RepID=UPI001F0C837B|nr:YceI family protein [Chryseobacterium sp. Y16C]UMQ44039.1 YceI family protein [Chryseobacterium sp. Y16C]
MRKLFLTLVLALISITAFAQSEWTVDPMHSSINFNIKHMGISFVQGKFDKFDGKVSTAGNNLEKGAFNFIVYPATINTGVDKRDKHLTSADFFDAEKYPQIRFEGGTVAKGKDSTYTLKGKLTIKDVTKEITVPATFGGVAKNQQGKEVLGFQSKFTINRLDYNIKYDPTGAGVAKDVEVALYFELIKQ